MKRIAPLLLLALLILVGAIAFKSYQKNQNKLSSDVAADSQAAGAVNSSVSTDEIATYKTPAGKVAFKELGFSVDTFWKNAPALNDEAFLKLEVRDVATNELIDAPGGLTVSVWSSNFGYGIVQPTIVKTALTGIYQASGIFFLAPDQWEVRVYMKKNGGKELTETLNVDLGVKPPSPMEDPTSPTYIMMKGMHMDHTVNHNRAKEVVDEKKARREAALNGKANPSAKATGAAHEHEHEGQVN